MRTLALSFKNSIYLTYFSQNHCPIKFLWKNPKLKSATEINISYFDSLRCSSAVCRVLWTEIGWTNNWTSQMFKNVYKIKLRVKLVFSVLFPMFSYCCFRCFSSVVFNVAFMSVLMLPINHVLWIKWCKFFQPNMSRRTT